MSKNKITESDAKELIKGKLSPIFRRNAVGSDQRTNL